MAIRYYFIANVLLLLTSLSVSIVARPISVVKSVGYDNDAIKSDHVDLFSLAAIKTGGRQSEDGMGLVLKTFGDKKNSGPSAGGKGHEYPSSVESLGNLKNSGPSSGGKGH